VNEFAEPTSPSLRILLCVTSLDRTQGGIASANRNIVRALFGMTSQPDVGVLAYHGGEPELEAEYLEGKQFVFATGCNSSKRRFVGRYIASCLRWRPNLVFVDHLHLSVIPYVLRWMIHTPYVMTCHGIEFDQGVTKLRSAAFRHAAARLTNSHYTADRLRQMFPGTMIAPCELALDDLGMPAEAGCELPLLPDAFGVMRPFGQQAALIVARLSASERYKGHDQLIQVMPAVARNVPDAQLVIAGSGDDSERLKALARDSGAGHAVLFAGFVAPALLATLYARCRLFAMPSRGEGFGLVYLEAMRFAKPCLASRVDAGSEVVVDGQTGLLVDPGNLEEIHTAIERVLSDPSFAERLGRAGLARLNQRYRFQQYRARLQQQLTALLPELAPSCAAETKDDMLIPA
jgi:glycosyltransferase involved in cell wall biosynthesis